ncbi:MAG TPA: pirin family protein [Aeromicrobium sp.]|nr:pirin family protein [Aeromicrobium sp.]
MDDRLIDPREVPLGGIRALNVWRTLPHRDLPTVGAWCFIDHFGPTEETMTVLPHPHIGLQTVTWPLSGEVRHRDNLGSDVVLRPGELNLMTAGDGVSHSEFSVLDSASGAPSHLMHGIQLWVALPDGPRMGPAAFEHISDLPRISGEGWRGIVLVGEFDGATSKATTYTPLVGVELTLAARSLVTLLLNREFEYALLAVDGPFSAHGDTQVGHRQVLYLAPGRDRIAIEAERDTTVLLLGGEPFTEPLVMWWNFIGRDHDEIVAARDDWEKGTGRFGTVEGHDGQIIPAPPMPQLRLKPRVRRG